MIAKLIPHSQYLNINAYQQLINRISYTLYVPGRDPPTSGYYSSLEVVPAHTQGAAKAISMVDAFAAISSKHPQTEDAGVQVLSA